MDSEPKQKILFIHTKLEMGGIETLFLRLSKVMHEEKWDSKFLIINDSKNDEIFDGVRKYSSLNFLKEFYKLKYKNEIIKSLIFHLNENKVKEYYGDIDVIHVGNARQYFLAKKIISIIDKPVKLIFGVYHANEVAWHFNGSIPMFEKLYRSDLFSSRASIYFPNEFSRDITLRNNPQCNIKNEFTFPLGVVEDAGLKKYVEMKKEFCVFAQ